MPVCWVVCPMVDAEQVIEDTDPPIVFHYRAPLVATLVDPEKGKPYSFSAMVGADRALCMVRGGRFGPLFAAPEVIDVFGAMFDLPFSHSNGAGRGQTIATLAPGPARAQLIARLVALGANTSGIGPNSTGRDVLQRIADAIGAVGSVDQVFV